MVVLAHIADIHLGAPLQGVPDYPGCPTIDPTESAYAAFDAMVADVLAGGYDGVLVAGDLFDRDVADDRALGAAEAAFDAFDAAGLPTAVILGNHDVASMLTRRLRLPPTAWLAPSDAAGTVRWADAGVAVHGRSIDDPAEPRDLSAGYPRPGPGFVNVGLLHTSVDGRWGGRTLAPTTVDRLESAGYDYWALGHVHRRAVVSPRAAYAGSVHPARRPEFGPRGYLRVETHGDGGLESTAVDTSPVVRERLSATSVEDVAAAFSAYRAAAPGRVVVWSLDGPSDLLGPARETASRFGGFAVVPGSIDVPDS